MKYSGLLLLLSMIFGICFAISMVIISLCYVEALSSNGFNEFFLFMPIVSVLFFLGWILCGIFSGVACDEHPKVKSR